MHKGSVSDSIEAKEYAITAGINGVRDFLASKNIDAEVESSEIYPTGGLGSIATIPCPGRIMPAGCSC